MPTVDEVQVPAFAFCSDGRCPGYDQQPVEGIRTTTAYTNGDLAGPQANAAGHVERSSSSVRFADETSDGPCPSCGKPRQVSEQERPEYARNSGQAQDALLNLGKTEANVKELQHKREIDELKRDQELAELRRELQELKERRGPGRPRKEEAAA
jgi:DNA repair exonuclease SbcCD ATPase subunit